MAPIHATKRSRNNTEELYEVPSDNDDSRRSYGRRARLSVDPSEPERSAAETPDLQDVLEADRQDAERVARMARVVGNHPAEHAIIEEIVCRNFMCHTHLEVKLGPLINFIIGHNGSGKSAVLTALTICLGGKATATNRGQSLKNFIKEGEEMCVLSVQLKNQGASAYRPDDYGDSIIVERQFTRSGTSGFKLKSASKKVVSTKRADLDDILDAFSLQLDNPMNILTQDQARQFLNHSNPSDKYRFFMKGTQLEALDNDYNHMANDLDNIELKIMARQEDLAHLKAKSREAEKLLELADRHSSLEGRISDTSRQMAWAQVEAEEQKIPLHDRRIAEAEEEILARARQEEEAAEASRAAAQAHESSKVTIDQFKADLAPQEDELATLTEEFNKNKQELSEIIVQQRQISEEVRSNQRQDAKIQDELRKEQERLANDGGVAQTAQDLQSAKEEVEHVVEQRQSHVDGAADFEQRLHHAKQQMDHSADRVTEKRAKVQACQREIQNIQQNQGNWMHAYDPNLPALLRAIGNDTRFREKPVGPLGRHVRLLKEEWSHILELSFGGTLNAFVVTNKDDQKILSELMAKTKCSSAILIGNGNRIDTSGHEPDPQLLTWMRAIEIDSDLVRNTLIINQTIEQVVLIKDRQEANDFMYRNAQPPRNVKICFCQQDGTNREGLRLTMTASGAQRSDPIRPPPRGPPRPRMKGDMEPRLNAEKQRLRELHQEVDNAEREKRDVDQQYEEVKQVINRHKRQTKDLQLEVDRAVDLVATLQHRLEEQTPSAGKLERLEAERQALKEESQITTNTFQQSVLERDRVDGAQKELIRRIKQRQLDVDETNARIQKAIRKTESLGVRRERATRENNQAHETLEDARRHKVDQEAARTAQLERIESFIRQATEISPRVPVDAGETSSSLDKKLHRLLAERERAEIELGGTRVEISERALAARRAWETQQASHDMLVATAQAIKHSMATRKDRWAKFRKFIKLRAVNTFTYLLSERQFRGHLEIVHQSKTLDIKIEPDFTKRTDKGRQTSTLSGGEKSFSTICLLIALWDAMGSPIRCLDEFDVFMDNVNRDVSMKMIIQAARRSVSRQFIFITPQSMGSLGVDNDVKIIKMSDPERGQTTIQFGP